MFVFAHAKALTPLHKIEFKPLESHGVCLFPTFLDLGVVVALDLCGDRNLSDFIKKILVCVLKMNEGFTDVERHKGE